MRESSGDSLHTAEPGQIDALVSHLQGIRRRLCGSFD
jgi:hypothetical protein